jgi:hypothetical protein
MHHDLASSRQRPNPVRNALPPGGAARKLFLIVEITMLKVQERARLIAAMEKAATDSRLKGERRALAANSATQL